MTNCVLESLGVSVYSAGCYKSLSEDLEASPERHCYSVHVERPKKVELDASRRWQQKVDGTLVYQENKAGRGPRPIWVTCWKILPTLSEGLHLSVNPS